MLFRLATCVVASALCAAPARSDETPPQRPNLLFFLADDQRADCLSCAGHPILRTPRVDGLAAGGVRFAEMFVTTSICAASRASLLTGLVERTHGFTFRTPPLADRFCRGAYPAVLRRAGYHTGHIGKFGVQASAEARAAMFDEFQDLFRNPYFKTQPDGSVRHLTDVTADRAIEFLRRRPGDRPFCLNVWFNAPHAEDSDKENQYPWPPSADGLYVDVEIPPAPLSDSSVFESQPEFLRNSFNRERWFWRWDAPEKYDRNIRAYYRLLSGVDAAVGRVLDELERLGLAENTVVVYSGDNGYYLASRGFAGKWSHYEESLRVPLVIHDPRPGARRGEVENSLALNIDVAPTLLALAGATDDAEANAAQGLDLLAADRDRLAARRDFFCEHLMDIGAAIPKWEGVHGARYVYARYFEQSPPYEFLHDLQADPQQLQNFAADPDYVDVLDRLRARSDELRDEYGGAFRASRE